MRTYIKSILILSLILNLASCTKDEDFRFDTVASGGNAILTDTKISRLDINNDVKISLVTKEGVTVSKVEIYNNTAASGASYVVGSKITDATISGTTATFKSSIIAGNSNFVSNQSSASGVIPIVVVATYSDNTVSTNPYSLTIARGINFVDADGVVLTSSGISNVKYKDSTSTILRYKVYKKYATTTVDKVTMQWKKNKAGTYSAGDATFSKTAGSIELANLDYITYGLHANDTLYYKFTVQSGTQTDYVETAIPIITQSFNASKQGEISDASAGSNFNLLAGNGTSTTNEIMFSTPFGIEKSGSTSITFVKVAGPSATYFKNADLFTAETAYLAGTPVTKLTGLVKDDVVVYKITRAIRDEVKKVDVITNFYGLLKVVDLTTVTSNLNPTVNSIKFEYKEGILMQK